MVLEIRGQTDPQMHSSQYFTPPPGSKVISDTMVRQRLGVTVMVIGAGAYETRILMSLIPRSIHLAQCIWNAFLYVLCRKRKRTSFDKQVAHVAKYPLLPACGPCQLRCADKFIQEERECINRQYWRCTFGERRAGLDSHISIYPVKRRRHGRKDTTARAHRLTYTLPKQVSKVPVCTVIILRTLGLRTDGTITEFMKAKQRSPEDNVAPSLTTMESRHHPTSWTMGSSVTTSTLLIPKWAITTWSMLLNDNIWNPISQLEVNHTLL